MREPVDPPKRRRKKALLLISDEPTSRYFIKAVLARTRYTIIEATTGREGLSLALTGWPSVIVLDLVMPGITELEVVNELKSNSATRNIPVILITFRSITPNEQEWFFSQSVTVLSKSTLDSVVLRQAV